MTFPAFNTVDYALILVNFSLFLFLLLFQSAAALLQFLIFSLLQYFYILFQSIDLTHDFIQLLTGSGERYNIGIFLSQSFKS